MIAGVAWDPTSDGLLSGVATEPALRRLNENLEDFISAHSRGLVLAFLKLPLKKVWPSGNGKHFAFSSHPDYVRGVDYSEFPSPLLTPLGSQLGEGVCDDLFPSIGPASSRRAHSQRAKERNRVASTAASRVLRADHPALRLPCGADGIIDSFDAASV